MHYSGCSGWAPLGPRRISALVVTRKAGIAYDSQIGAFVVDSTLARAAGATPWIAGSIAVTHDARP
jgi:hypothetical protein